MINEILEDQWLLTKRIGKGAFSFMFIAENLVHDGMIAAVKVLPKASSSSVLRWEIETLKALKKIATVPRFISSGQHFPIMPQPAGQKDFDGTLEKFDYIIMEYLGGEDMSKLRDRLRSKHGFISVPIAVYLSLQILSSLKDLHDVGYVHRDIKPANFVRRSQFSTQFCVVDFGLAKLHRDRFGKVRTERPMAGFRGTRAYASPHAHNLADLCPRDDLYSLFIVFIDLLCGKLPWTEANRAKDNDMVKSTKQEYLVDHVESMAEWVLHQLKQIDDRLSSVGTFLLSVIVMLSY